METASVCQSVTSGMEWAHCTAEAPPQRSTFAAVASFLSSLLLRIVSFATISIPLLFYRLLTWSFTLHLNFSSLVMILGFVATATYLVVRYRFLTKYSRLKPIEPQKAASSFDLHPDSSEDAGYSKPAFKYYPEEFLSAFLSSIKIFGYLEQPVFHELARHLQTKKLLAGDTLFRTADQEKSFYIVVDGHVQMLLKPENEPDSPTSDEDEELWTENSDYDRFRNYTLINEVDRGGTLSSLFTILSVFRESFDRLEEKERTVRQRAASRLKYANSSPSSGKGADMSREGSVDDVFPNLADETELRKRYRSSTGNAYSLRLAVASPQSQLAHAHRMDTDEEEPLEEVPAVSTESNELASDEISDGLGTEPDHAEPVEQKESPIHAYEKPARPSFDDDHTPQLRRFRSVHPNIIARATVDTTLAVIPEEAFHKLVQKFPKAAAHIVQVIITRFHRVTLMTSRQYLGLTEELLRLEKLMNESVSLPTLPPDFFAPGGMERLRRKFAPDDEATKEVSSLYPAGLGKNDEPGIIRAIDIIDRSTTPPIVYNASSAAYNNNSKYPSNQRSNGSTLPASPNRISHRHSPPRENEYSIEDDEHLRNSVLRCVTTALGINTGSGTDIHALHGARFQKRFEAEFNPTRLQPHQSPSLFSGTSTFVGGRASAGPDLTHSYDDDTGSVGSSNHSGSDVFTGEGHRSSVLSLDDIQILYYPKDVVLVHESEHNNGIFFVIDGMLDVSMAPNEGGAMHHADTHLHKEEVDLLARRTGRALSKRQPDLSPSSSTSTQHTSLLGKSESPFTHSTARKADETVASDAPAGRSNTIKEQDQKHRYVKKPLFVVKPGGLAGYLDSLTGYPSMVEIRAKTDTYVGYISKKSLERITDKNPTVMLKLAKHLVSALSPLLLYIDVSLEWMQVGAGQIIYRENQPSESIYMVLHGRLRTIREKDEGDIEILGEFGRGDTVGELEVITETPALSTLHAIRDSELARMPKTLFNALALRHPEIILQISRMVALRSLQLVTKKNAPGPIASKQVVRLQGNKDTASAAIASISAQSGSYPELYGRNNVNLKTIGILPVNASVPITDFAEHLKHALLHSVGATCVLLNSATQTAVMGKHSFSRMGKLKMASWLAEQEDKVRIVLYLADSGVTSQWTRTCIRQADCILLVGLGDGDPSVGEYERFLINMKTTARKELVLLHGERACGSGTTQNWLKNRLWIQAHHHIFMPMRQHAAALGGNNGQPTFLAASGRKMSTMSGTMLNNVKDQLEKYYSAVPTFGRLLVLMKKNSFGTVSTSSQNDFNRLARRLCGKSVALVLGGGGARGISHIGVIQALEEADIPIDIIGGTSIGSFVGGLYAKNMDLVSTIARSKMFSGRVSSIWRQIMDVTFPLAAWTTGHEFNRAIWKCFGDSQIEDFWLPYYAVTANITFSRMEVHTTGYAWRYIRASMSLSGYMPPICDNGNMLVDGGYIDNLPVTVAKNMGADIIIAVDVASEDDTSPVHYGDSVSGWWALLHSFNPFRTYNIPSIADIQSRLAYVSSVARLEEAKTVDGTLYLKLPVQAYGTLEFSKFHDIMQIGYNVGRRVISHWRSAGYASGRLVEDESEQKLRGKAVKGKGGRRNSI